jgi:hypothetical protein
LSKLTHVTNPGTSVRGGTSLVEIRVVAALKLVRVVFDVDGLSSDDRLRMEHHIFYFTSAEEGTYTFMLSTGRRSRGCCGRHRRQQRAYC